MVVRPIMVQDLLFTVVNMESTDAGLRSGAETYHSRLGLQTLSVDDDRGRDREVNPSTVGPIGRAYSGKESLAQGRPRTGFKQDGCTMNPGSVFEGHDSLEDGKDMNSLRRKRRNLRTLFFLGAFASRRREVF